MKTILYDAILLFGLGIRLCYEKIIGKKRSFLWERLGFIPYAYRIPEGKRVYWVHAVSVGETKGASALIAKIRKEDKKAFIILSSMTETDRKSGV